MDDLVEAIDKLLERGKVYSNIEVREIFLQIRTAGISVGIQNPCAYTYSRINIGMSRLLPLFIYEARNSYRYVGLNFPFNGELVHYPQGGSPTVVGVWTNGRLKWTDSDVTDFDSWLSSVKS